MKSYQTTFSIKRLWIILSVGMVVMFGILLLLGQQIYQQAPPIPEAVKSQSGETLFTRADIETGQNIWQSIGGMEQGSIWGHGSYLAPDWSADWLHREAEALLALSASQPLPGVSATQAEAMRRAGLQEEMRRNTYDPASGVITVSDTRARAIRQVQQHFVSLYDGGDPASLKLRRDYAFPVYGELSA
ncbi:nitric oxide reductase large subunit, partial [Stakelama sediminis]|nr:nitric oxide reductase large subunit [Stakelama sediminis]